MVMTINAAIAVLMAMLCCVARLHVHLCIITLVYMLLHIGFFELLVHVASWLAAL